MLLNKNPKKKQVDKLIKKFYLEEDNRLFSRTNTLIKRLKI